MTLAARSSSLRGVAIRGQGLGQRRPHRTAVVEDLGDLRPGGDEEALGLAPEGVPQAPGLTWTLSPTPCETSTMCRIWSR